MILFIIIANDAIFIGNDVIFTAEDVIMLCCKRNQPNFLQLVIPNPKF